LRDKQILHELQSSTQNSPQNSPRNRGEGDIKRNPGNIKEEKINLNEKREPKEKDLKEDKT
jgi:hypothetical protein